MDTSDNMEIIRQRLFIDHDHKSQRQVTIEYTIKSKMPKLKHIFLNYDKFLPSLVIRDERNSILPLMSSRDTEILYSNYINLADGEKKIFLQKELNEIKNKKTYLIWISLKNKPIPQDEIRIITMTYLPEIGNIKKSKIFIKFVNQNFPVYYSLFSPVNFNFSKPQFRIFKNNDMIIQVKPPDFVYVFNSYQSLSIRITADVSEDFGLLYSLASLSSFKVLTKLGAIFLSILPLSFFIIDFNELDNFKLFYQKQAEIALFTIGASLLLPNLESDRIIKRELILWYIVPIILAFLLLLFVK